MLITFLQQSSSRYGGWIIATSNHRRLAQTFADLPKDRAHPLLRPATPGRWWVADEVLDRLAPACSNFAEVCRDVGRHPRSGPPPSSSPPALSAYGALYLRDNAPDYVVRAVYRALAKVLHPDTATTDAERQERHIRMQRLNRAYAAIEATWPKSES